jgi:AcrR family transcriptional regulator
MATKVSSNQPVTRRQPRQRRALEKVGLILEAALRLLERDGTQALNTNRLAEVAGVSIGTLYQYFPDKAAVLDALAERELAGLEEKVMTAMRSPPPPGPGGRIRLLVGAVINVYGGRTGIHRQLFEHVMNRRGRNPFPALREGIIKLLSRDGVVDADQQSRKLSEADAFVMTNAISGVLRAVLASPERIAPARRQAIEDSLVRLVVGFTPA